MKLQFLRASEIRKFAKERGRRVGKDFLYALDSHIHSKLSKAVTTHNGGKLTLDAHVAGFVGLESPSTRRSSLEDSAKAGVT